MIFFTNFFLCHHWSELISWYVVLSPFSNAKSACSQYNIPRNVQNLNSNVTKYIFRTNTRNGKLYFLQWRRFYLIVPILTCKSVIAHFCKMFIAAKLKLKKEWRQFYWKVQDHSSNYSCRPPCLLKWKWHKWVKDHKPK